MSTVYNWLDPIHQDLDIAYPIMDKTLHERVKIASPSLDGIFVLGKGFVLFDNQPVSWELGDLRERHSNIKWIVGDTSLGGLLVLFLILTSWINAVPISSFDLTPYLPSLGPNAELKLGD